jgi:PilZ domain-containing protein
MSAGRHEIPGRVGAKIDLGPTDGFRLSPYVRIPYVRRGVLFRGERKTAAVLCNLSVLGVYVTFPAPALEEMPEPGEALQIAFLLPGDPAPVEADAVVTWHNADDPERAGGLPPGCGLRFVSLRPSDHHRIGALVHDYQHAAHPRVSVPRPYSGFVRVPFVQPCLLAGAPGTWEGVLCNVSLVGAYVAVDPIPCAGERVRLAFHVSGGRSLEVDGEVAWVNAEEPQLLDALPAGCGIRFLDPPGEACERLRALVDEHEALPRAGLD